MKTMTAIFQALSMPAHVRQERRRAASRARLNALRIALNGCR